MTTLKEKVTTLQNTYGHLDAPALIEALITKEYTDNTLALVSSFGTESAVLLHMAAKVNSNIPVLLVDTYKLFPETYAYTAELTELLGLTNLTHVRPEMRALKEADSDSTLWQTVPDHCCYLRKVLPLQRALTPYTAWISGRKRAHGGDRKKLAVFEEDGTHIKINPLATWGADDIDRYFGQHRLPSHPLLAAGFLSVGCVPCTAKPSDASDPRSGRWQGMGKTECGIHMPTDYVI